MVVLVAAKGLALTATTDPSGRAHMEGIVPGAYKVFAPGNREGKASGRIPMFSVSTRIAAWRFVSPKAATKTSN